MPKTKRRNAMPRRKYYETDYKTGISRWVEHPLDYPKPKKKAKNPLAKISIAPSTRRKGKWDVFVGGIHRVTKATLKGAEGYAKRIQAANPVKRFQTLAAAKKYAREHGMKITSVRKLK